MKFDAIPQGTIGSEQLTLSQDKDYAYVNYIAHANEWIKDIDE